MEPVIITNIVSLVFSKYAIPLWGVLSGYLMYRLKIHTSKRDDFTVIRDTLYKEIERLKANAEETKKMLLDAKAETDKCEARYFELSTQHRELLKHCIFLTKELKALKQDIKDHVEQTTVNDRQINSNSKTTGTTD